MGSASMDDLEKRTIQAMNGLLWTYKTHYKLAEYYEAWGRRLNILSAGGTALLATAIIWGQISRNYLFMVALAVAFVSWLNAMLGFASNSKDHYHAADRYHVLFEDFKDFYELELTESGAEADEMLERYDSLKERRNQLNLNSPRTTNKKYSELDKEEVYATMETTEDEVERLVGISS